MDISDTEICGFLYVKSVGKRYITQKVKKKALMSKVWKRLWCSVKKLGPNQGVEIQYNNKLDCSSNVLRQSEKNNFVIIPPSVSIHRIHSKTKQFAFCISSDRKPLLSLSANSETETQRWMKNIRYLLKPKKHSCLKKFYNVSIVDNKHSKVAGLTGLYGDLTINKTGIYINDGCTDEIIESFEWREFGQFHLMSAGRPEDVKRICVMHTTKDFRCGIGELYMFCFNANELLQDLVTQGRGPKHKQSFQNFNNENFEMLQNNGVTNFSLPQESNIPLCELNIDTNRENLHSCSHKKHDVSIVSEIYEEIGEEICSFETRTVIPTIYEDVNEVLCNVQTAPPPLPPRQGQKPISTENIKANIERYDAKVPDFKKDSSNTEIYIKKITSIDNSSYVPMSPQLKDIDICKSDIMESLRENEYVAMR